MRPVVIGSKTVQLPSEWQEFSVAQLELIARLVSSSLPVETVKLYLVLNLLALRITRKVGDDTFRFVWRHRRGTITTDEMARLISVYDFLFGEIEEKPGTYIVVSGLTRDPYPHLTDGLFPFFGPGDVLDRLTYDQFVYAHTYMSQLTSSDLQALPRLLACLWHRRQHFDPSLIERDARRLSRLSKERQTVMFWYWCGCLSAIRQLFPRVFSGGASGGNVFEEQQRVINALADGDMTKADAVRRGLLYDALFSMDETIRRTEETKQALQK